MLSFTNVFYEIATLLGIATILGGLALWLRQPLIMAFIAVGALVGPAGFSMISANEEVELLAELGIALLLFVVGLKLDLHEIRSVGKVAILTGLGQILITFALGDGIAFLLGFNLVSAFYIAIGLTFSSTIIIVKLLSDKKEIDALHSRIAVGVLIVQDIVVVLVTIALTAFTGENGQGSLGPALLMVLVKGLGFLAVLTLITRYVLPKILHPLAQSIELLVLFAITWAIVLASVGDGLGFSKEVGAFLAGVSLASTEYRSILGARLVTLRDFLLLFFFIDLGIHIDITHLGAQLIPGIIFSAFVLIGKPLLVMTLLGYLGYRKYTSAIASLSLGQISEFSLILGTLGVTLEHISEEILGLITLVGLITMGLSTYGILYSHQIYEQIGSYLNIFERKIKHVEEEIGYIDTPNSSQTDIILFGLGRYGGSMIWDLQSSGLNVLGIDFNPEIVKVWQKKGVSAFYGDVEDPEFAATLPLNKARWVVSTIPGLQGGLTLLHSLKHHNFNGKIALTSHNQREMEILKNTGADLVLLPFRDAAAEAARTLSLD